MNGARILGNVAGLHEIPNPLSDNPFPSFGVRFGLPLGSLCHGFASSGVEGEPLGLECRLVENGVVSATSATAQLLIIS